MLLLMKRPSLYFKNPYSL